MVGLARVFWPLLLVSLAIGLVVGLALPTRLTPLPAAGLLVALGLGLVGLLWWCNRRLRSFFKGAEGEERVARELGFLPAEFFVFHSVWLPTEQGGAARDDVDHVVVGPTGVFSIETKNWAGPIEIRRNQILLAGKPPPRSPLEQTYRAARHVRDHILETAGLEVVVRPVLCFVGGPIPRDESEGPEGVEICGSDELVSVLRRAPREPFPEERMIRVVNVFGP